MGEALQRPGNSVDLASSVVVSPDGKTVFVTGRTTSIFTGGSAQGLDYATIAYNAATGAQRWVKRYNGPGKDADYAYSIAVSGGKVFVTGFSTGTGTGLDYATIAYNATTGAQLWVERYNGPGNSNDYAASVAVSPAGDKVFVTGQSPGATSPDYATIAYSATTGAKLWVKRYNGPAKSLDSATSVAVSPGGGTVFVTGESAGINSGPDYATVAYNATTGAQLWVKRYNGPATPWTWPRPWW